MGIPYSLTVTHTPQCNNVYRAIQKCVTLK